MTEEPAHDRVPGPNGEGYVINVASTSVRLNRQLRSTKPERAGEATCPLVNLQLAS
jgi:hypothetical protein